MSRHHRAAGYGTTQSRRARSKFAPLVEGGGVPCGRCGGPIEPGTPWDVGHHRDLVDGYDGVGEYRPEHRSCNRRAGGKRGAQIVNARRRAAGNFRAW